jgi:uncharacterized protein (TIGR02391 family)
MRLQEFLPPANAITQLTPEEIGGCLLVFFNSIEGSQERGVIQAEWIANSIQNECPEFAPQPVHRALIEGWSWLITNGFLAPRDKEQQLYGLFVVTRKGKSLRSKSDFDEFLKRLRLPRELLHPTIALKTWPAFLRGEYETAVFQAFKEIEVTVRTRGNFTPNDLGVKLMREAFQANQGPLCDKNEPASEQESLMHLFAGAIGRFKNPSSHRHVALLDPAETFEMLTVASHLLRIAEQRP